MMDRRSFLRGAAASLVAGPAAAQALAQDLLVKGAEHTAFAYIDERAVFCRLSQIRDLLLPGLYEIRGSYDMVEREWENVFATARASEDQPDSTTGAGRL